MANDIEMNETNICPDCGSHNMGTVIDGTISCLSCYGTGCRDIWECLKCGDKANINFMEISVADEADPYPVVTCRTCGGTCEQII